MDNYKSEIEDFVKAGRRAGEYGLLKCSSGNLSVRIDGELVLLSGTRSWLGEIKTDQVAVCDIASGESVNGVMPTVESRFHLGIMREQKEVNCVLHFQSPYVTAIAAGEPERYNYNVIIEVPFYIGDPAIVKYSLPGSDELADDVVRAMADSKMVIMKNHGAVTVGESADDAIQRAVFFEMACRILLTNPQAKPISVIDIQKIRESYKI